MNQTSPIVVICTWFSRLVWLNLCWGGGVLLGGIFLGFFPASTTVLIMMRRYLNGVRAVTLKDFFSIWRSEVIIANKSAWPLVLITISLIWYLTWCLDNGSQMLQLLSLILLPVLVFNCLLLSSVLIQVSMFNGTPKQQWLGALALMKKSPILPIVMFLGVIVCLIFGLIFPVFFLLFSISPVCLITMAWYLHRFPEYKKLN